MLQAIKISERVYWVGAIDWALRDFHGYTTTRGSTYNAYLILGSEPILIDTVKKPFFDEMLERIRSVIDPQKIKYIISNHAEMDHAGALQETIAVIKPKKVFATSAGVSALKAHFHWQQLVTAIKPGEVLALGDANLAFVETKMLHWPDSMFTYFANDEVLFSQDGFGMHLATENILVDENPSDIVYAEAAKYYANILLPYSSLVLGLLKSLPSLNLSLKIIAPDHGPIWRGEDKIQYVLKLWERWARQSIYPKAVIVYDTMWQSTAKMATAIADGVMSSNNGVSVEVMPLAVNNRSDIAMALLEAGAIMLGSPTINQQIFPTLADTICYLKGLKRKNLIGQAFGSHGWAGEGVKILQNELMAMQITLIAEAVKARYVPTVEDLQNCHNLGRIQAETLHRNFSESQLCSI